MSQLEQAAADLIIAYECDADLLLEIAALKAALADLQEQQPHPSCKSDTLVNRGALILALNSLKRGTQSQIEIAEELEKTVQHLEKPEPAATVIKNETGQVYVDFVGSIFDLIGKELYTQPPRREWVGLTDSQKTQLYFESDKLLLSKAECEIYMDGVNDAAAKLKELNHGQ